VSGLTVKRVLTTRNEGCVLEGDVTVTDAEGFFDFDRRDEFRAIVPLYGDPVDPMTICVYRDGEVVGSAEKTLMGGAPKDMEMECDLELLRIHGLDVFCGPPYWVEQMRRGNP